MANKLKKKCKVYKGNPDCEGEFWVNSNVYMIKHYCDKCKLKKQNDYRKKYYKEKRAEARKVRAKKK